MVLIGKPYRHNDYVGKVVGYVENGSFKGCYEVHVTNEVTGEDAFGGLKRKSWKCTTNKGKGTGKNEVHSMDK